MIHEFLNLRPVDETALFPMSFHIQLPDDSEEEMPSWEICGLISCRTDDTGYISSITATLGGRFFTELEAGYDERYLNTTYGQVAKTLSFLISIETQIALAKQVTVSFSDDRDELVFSHIYERTDILGTYDMK